MEEKTLITPLDQNGLDSIKKYLEAVKELCSGKLAHIESFILEHGKAFENQRSLPKNVKRGTLKQCFANAAKVAVDTDLIYCEGYAITDIGMPLLHAWCIDENDNVIELTWPKTYGPFAYFGIPFTPEHLMETIHQSGVYGILDNPPHNRPLLLGKIPKTKWYHKNKNQTENLCPTLNAYCEA